MLSYHSFLSALSVLFILLTTFLILLPRITWQLIYSRRKREMEKENRRTIRDWCRNGGALFIDSYQHPPVTSEWSEFWIMMKERKKGQKLGKIPVLGSYDDLPELAALELKK